jgi:ApaG protein
MNSATTNGITVKVITEYLADESAPLFNRYFFSYQISIENGSDQTVQLKSRHWHIIDGIGGVREVEGEGVVGQQPMIEPGRGFQYNSFCLLNTPIGRMYGVYHMVKTLTNEAFQVDIPEFRLESITIQN